jgi:Leucine-rich repeat (LRR) protein
LEKLDISTNKLKAIHKWLGSMTSLKELDISENEKIKTLPNSLKQLCNLEVFHFSETSLRKVPKCIRNFNNLKKLSLGGTLRKLPELIDKLIFFSIPPYFSIPFIDSLKIPRWISELSNLEYLYLGNWVNKIPENISNLKNLKQLNIHCSKIKLLPESFGNLSALKEISISGCKNLIKLPESFSNLASLEKLKLTDSKIMELPESFGNLRSLKEFIFNQRYDTKL